MGGSGIGGREGNGRFEEEGRKGGEVGGERGEENGKGREGKEKSRPLTFLKVGAYDASCVHQTGIIWKTTESTAGTRRRFLQLLRARNAERRPRDINK